MGHQTSIAATAICVLQCVPASVYTRFCVRRRNTRFCVSSWHVTYCTTSAVKSKSKKTSIAENVILGETNYGDAVLEKAADTTAKQLADGWFTWTNTQQPPLSSTLPKNTRQIHCDIDSCAPKEWICSTQTRYFST